MVLEIYWFTHAPTHARMQVCTHWWCSLQYRLFDVRLNWLSVSWTIKGFELMWNGETFATFWILVFSPQNLIKRLFLRRAKLHISTSHTRYALWTSVYLPVRGQTTQLPSLTVCIYRFLLKAIFFAFGIQTHQLLLETLFFNFAGVSTSWWSDKSKSPTWSQSEIMNIQHMHVVVFFFQMSGCTSDQIRSLKIQTLLTSCCQSWKLISSIFKHYLEKHLCYIIKHHKKN